MSSPLRFKLLLAVITLLAFWGVHAANPYDDLPIELTADNAEYDHDSGIATYTGNVHIQQGEMFIKGDKVTIHFVESHATQMDAWGKPAVFHYVPANSPPVDGKGDHLQYNVAKQSLHMFGNAWLDEGGNQTTADTLNYNITTRKVTGKRVSITYLPSKEQ